MSVQYKQVQVTEQEPRYDGYVYQVSGPSLCMAFGGFFLFLLLIVLIVMVARTNSLLQNMLLLKMSRRQATFR